jgi:hypothetical protein
MEVMGENINFATTKKVVDLNLAWLILVNLNLAWLEDFIGHPWQFEISRHKVLFTAKWGP